MSIWAGRNWFITIAFYLIAQISVAQEIIIETGKNAISLDEPFTLKLIIKSHTIKNTYSSFPDYPHLHKRDVSSSTTTGVVNGKNIITQIISQNYLATQEGTFILPASQITVNDKIIPINKITLQVGPPVNPDYKLNNELYEELLEIERQKNQPVNVKADAFFSLSTDKTEVYVGEGFMVMLALYVAQSNKADLDSYKVDEQLINILQKIRPSNCWEENFNIEEFQETQVNVNNKPYKRYAIYQTVYYPLNTHTVIFPKVGLTMIKYKSVPNAASGETTRKVDYETFYTTPTRVKVKPLPSHPLREQVSVGVYRLKEAISSRNPVTGKSFNYHFTITGEGNFSTVHFNPSVSDKYFDFFTPRIVENISRSKEKISGTKSFQYQIVPKEPGTYVMRKYFEWIYFNTKAQKYDTLSSAIVINVTGESRKNADISLNKLEPPYTNMMRESSRLRDMHTEDWVQLCTNILILLMLLTTLILFFIKR
jgi:hypothetical protein